MQHFNPIIGRESGKVMPLETGPENRPTSVYFRVLAASADTDTRMLVDRALSLNPETTNSCLPFLHLAYPEGMESLPSYDEIRSEYAGPESSFREFVLNGIRPSLISDISHVNRWCHGSGVSRRIVIPLQIQLSREIKHLQPKERFEWITVAEAARRSKLKGVSKIRKHAHPDKHFSVLSGCMSQGGDSLISWRTLEVA